MNRVYNYWYVRAHPLLHTVQCRYNAVNFLPNPHNRHPIGRPWEQDMGVYCDSKIWFTFCHYYRSAVCDKLERVITVLDSKLVSSQAIYHDE